MLPDKISARIMAPRGIGPKDRGMAMFLKMFTDKPMNRCP
jgi:hypothetical protein